MILNEWKKEFWKNYNLDFRKVIGYELGSDYTRLLKESIELFDRGSYAHLILRNSATLIGANIINLSGSISLDEEETLLMNCDLIVTSDLGLCDFLNKKNHRVLFLSTSVISSFDFLSRVREIVEFGAYRKPDVSGMDWDINTVLNNFNKVIITEKIVSKVIQETRELSKSVGIVMPLYNQERYVGRTIKSILDQRFKEWNLYVVNDGSTDKSKEIVDLFNDKRIISISHMRNKGISIALNSGFRLTKEPYLTWISGDNIYHEDYLSEMLHVMTSTKNIDFIYSNYDVIDGDDNFLRSVTHLPYDRKQLLDSYNLGICFLFTEQIKKAAGEYREGYAQDYDMAVRMSQLGRFYRLDKTLGAFRQHAEQASSKDVSEDTKQVKEFAKEIIKKH